MTVSPLLRPESPTAFDDFYKHYFVRVLALIRKHFPRCDAEEIAQETMTRCLVNFHTLDPHRDPWNWVSSVARNAAIDSLRRNRKSVSTDELPEVSRGADDATYEAVVVSERRRSLRLAMRRLRPADRQLIEDHVFEGLACAEMAAIRDMTPNALRQKLHRARGRLATELRKVGATLGVVPVALHHKFEKAARRANDVSFAAGPAGASALGMFAVAGVATILVGTGGGRPITTASGSYGGDVVAAVDRGAAGPRAAARPVVREARAATRPPVRPGPGPGPIPKPDVPKVVISTHGDPVQHPEEPSGLDIVVPTPVGDLEYHHDMGWMPGQGVLCWAGVTTCPEMPA